MYAKPRRFAVHARHDMRVFHSFLPRNLLNQDLDAGVGGGVDLRQQDRNVQAKFLGHACLSSCQRGFGFLEAGPM